MVRLFALFLTCCSALAAIPTERFYAWGRTYIGVSGGIPSYPVTTTLTGMDAANGTDVGPVINAAIAAETAGHAVKIDQDGWFKITTPIQLKTGVELIGRGTNTVLVNETGSSCIVGGTTIDSNPFPNSALPTITSGALKGNTTVTLSDASTFSSGTLMIVRAYPNLTNEWMTFTGPEQTTGTTDSGGHNSELAQAPDQIFWITGKSGNVITVDRPFAQDMTNNGAPMWYNGSIASFGVSHLTISNVRSNGTTVASGLSCIQLNQAHNFWIQDVNTRNTYSRAFLLTKCANGEIRHCWLNGHQSGGPNGEQINLSKECSGILVEDNIGISLFPFICLGDAGQGVMGNAILFNYAYGNGTASARLGAAIYGHGAYENWNLIEGNIVPKVHMDGYKEGKAYTTIFRNWITGDDGSATTMRHAVSLDRWVLYSTVACNVLGTNSPSLSNYELTGQDANAVWRFGYPQPGNNTVTWFSGPTYPDWGWPGLVDSLGGSIRFGPTTGSVVNNTTVPGNFTGVRSSIIVAFQDPSSTNSYVYATVSTDGTGSQVVITPAKTIPSGSYLYLLDPDDGVTLHAGTPNGWQNYRPETKATLIRAGNYDFVTGTYDSDAAYDTFAQSLFADYASATPSWWPAGLRFPPVQPTSGTQVTMNPAMARYFNIDVSGGGSPASSGSSRSNGRVTIRGRNTGH
jgi:hypothetical protein